MKQGFETFKLHEGLVQALKQQRIIEPTEVQSQVMPLIQRGRDVIAQSQTGSGKTLAYLLPLLNNLQGKKDEVEFIVLAPTRELAKQIYGEVQRYITALPNGEILHAKLLMGGTDRERQLRQLNTPPQILIGTPGRIKDLVESGFSIHTARTFVIDEADQMVEMGFLEEIAQLHRSMKRGHQTLCFSATIPKNLESFLKKMMNQPYIVRVDQSQVASTVEHHYFLTKNRNRLPILVELCQQYRPYLGIIFVSKKEEMAAVYEALLNGGIETGMIHGDMNTRERKKVLEQFRAGKFPFLLASDVAARGIDIEGVSHIISYDLPKDLNYYVHRAGRTGRAGAEGLSVVLVAEEQEKMLQNLIEKKRIKFFAKRLVRGEIETAPPLVRQRPQGKRPAPSKSVKEKATVGRPTSRSKAGLKGEQSQRKQSGQSRNQTRKRSGRASSRTK